ncbi:MAG: deaminase [Rhodobacteraceae bacterium]|nr:deaminase [Paracoccaceae bacterium]
MEIISTGKAPQAIGPYSQAIHQGDLLFASGQIPLDLEGKIVEGGVEAQTRQVFENIKGLLASQGLSLSHVIKCSVFVTDLRDFNTINAVYAEAFGNHKPSRTTLQVAGLPLGSSIEIEIVASYV